MNKNNKKNERIGQTNINKQGHKMTIINYIDNANVTVKFESGWEFTSSYQRFKSGNIKDRLSEKVYGIGFIGNTDYNKNELSYRYWIAILYRVKINKGYGKKSSICEEWKNLENFTFWFNDNYYKIDDETMEIDKDILVKGNKLYSPKTCIFVPKSINQLFVRQKRKNKHTKNYLIGVYDSGYGGFRATIQKYSKTVDLGTYNTQIEAFQAYKKEKENHIKEIADNYKDKIPEKLYNAMYNYKVEITD